MTTGLGIGTFGLRIGLLGVFGSGLVTLDVLPIPTGTFPVILEPILKSTHGTTELLGNMGILSFVTPKQDEPPDRGLRRNNEYVA